MFINLKDGKFTVNSSRFPDAAVTTQDDLMSDFKNETAECLTASVESSLMFDADLKIAVFTGVSGSGEFCYKEEAHSVASFESARIVWGLSEDDFPNPLIDMDSQEKALKKHIILCIDSGWCFVHQKGAAEQVFRHVREQLSAFVMIEDISARIVAMEEALKQIVDAGWPHINTIGASDNVKKVFSNAHQCLSDAKNLRENPIITRVDDTVVESSSKRDSSHSFSM